MVAGEAEAGKCWRATRQGIASWETHPNDESRRAATAEVVALCHSERFSKYPGAALLIEDYLKEWLSLEKENIKHSTWLGYKKILSYHLIPSFGSLALADFRRKHARDWTIAHPDMSAKRMRNVLSVFRVALGAAVERELIESNP